MAGLCWSADPPDACVDGGESEMRRSGRDWVDVAAVEAAHGTHLRRRPAVNGVRGSVGRAGGHRREAAWAMLRPAWALRKRLITFAIAMSAVVLQGCGEIILTSGLDLDDEFTGSFEGEVVAPRHLC
jgi:hypothetical protein